MKTFELIESANMSGYQYIYKWLRGLFPDHQKRREFLMFLSQINRGIPIEQPVIIKYASQIDETILLFFITYIGRNHLNKYAFEKEMPGMTWIKDAGTNWNDNANTFKPEQVPGHNIYEGAKEIEAFEWWLQNLNKLL